MNKIISKYQQQTEKAARDYYKLMGAAGYILNKIEALKETPYYKKELKNASNKYYQVLLNHETVIGNKRSIEENNLDPQKVWDQQEQAYTYFESWFDLLFDCPLNRQEMLDNYIKLGVKMYL